MSDQQLNWNQRQRFTNQDGTMTVEGFRVFRALLVGLDLSPDTLDAPDFVQPFVRPEEPLNPIPVVVSASPTVFDATRHGAITVAGGTVTSVAFKRLGSVQTFVGFQGKIEVLQGDEITVTWSVAPTVTFFPT